MRRAMTRAVIIGIVFTAVTLALLVNSIRSSFSHSCEVCMTFNGRRSCREAAGSTREEALLTATQNACAFVASGMTMTVQCQNTRPTSVSCTAD